MDISHRLRTVSAGTSVIHVLGPILDLSATAKGRYANLHSSSLSRWLDKWDLSGVFVEGDPPETGFVMPEMSSVLFATVVVMTIWLLPSLTFPPRFTMCLLCVIVFANVGMIGDVVAWIGGEYANVVLLIACSASKMGSHCAIVV